MTEAGAALVYALVWRGLKRDAAAEAAGITVDYSRRLMKSPEIMALSQPLVDNPLHVGGAHSGIETAAPS